MFLFFCFFNFFYKLTEIKQGLLDLKDLILAAVWKKRTSYFCLVPPPCLPPPPIVTLSNITDSSGHKTSEHDELLWGLYNASKANQ